MNTTGERSLSTADLAQAAERREQPPHQEPHREEPARDLRRPDAGVDRRMEHDGDLRPPEGMRQGMQPGMQPPTGSAGRHEQLAPLFLPQIAQNFRSRWDEVQIGFVDDPARAVRQADELVAQVMKNLAETFADERAQVESQLNDADTEHLRVALRRYRSFFQRLLSL